MYTFSPLATVDTINDHFGFYMILVAMIVVLVIAVSNADSKEETVLAFVLTILISVGAAVVSWNTGEIKEYKNTPVVATLKGFVAESHIEKSGMKPYQEKTVHNQFVVYIVDNNEVMLPATVGMTYPQQATLFKN